MSNKVKAIFLDCDGVLTTGSYFYSKDGKYLKEFSARDGKGYAMAREKGINILVISEEPDVHGREITKKRCQDQKVDVIFADSPNNKLDIAKNKCEELSISLEDCAYIGDDVGDWPLLKEVGFSITVANATKETVSLVKKRKGYVTSTRGGKGAVREAIEHIIELNKE